MCSDDELLKQNKSNGVPSAASHNQEVLITNRVTFVMLSYGIQILA